MSLTLPKSGSAAAAYYRTFPSPEIAGWLLASIKEGMTIVDVGAHIGVYTLVAARVTGSTGVVHAIEPQGECAKVIGINAERNSLENVRIHRLALGGQDGTAHLVVDERSMGGLTMHSVSKSSTAVRQLTLRSFLMEQRLSVIDVLKLDVAGNEFDVLMGARTILGISVRSIICKLYHPDVVRARFGDTETHLAILGLLRDCGYDVSVSLNQPAHEEELSRHFAGGTYSVPIFARFVP